MEATAAAIEGMETGAAGRRLASAWADATSATYRADSTVEQTIGDIVILESLGPEARRNQRLKPAKPTPPD